MVVLVCALPGTHHAGGTAKSPVKVPDAMSVSTSVNPVAPSPVSPRVWLNRVVPKAVAPLSSQQL